MHWFYYANCLVMKLFMLKVMKNNKNTNNIYNCVFQDRRNMPLNMRQVKFIVLKVSMMSNVNSRMFKSQMCVVNVMRLCVKLETSSVFCAAVK